MPALGGEGDGCLQEGSQLNFSVEVKCSGWVSELCTQDAEFLCQPGGLFDGLLHKTQPTAHGLSPGLYQALPASGSEEARAALAPPTAAQLGRASCLIFHSN